MENATAADSSQSNVSRVYIWKDKTTKQTDLLFYNGEIKVCWVKKCVEYNDSNNNEKDLVKKLEQKTLTFTLMTIILITHSICQIEHLTKLIKIMLSLDEAILKMSY